MGNVISSVIYFLAIAASLWPMAMLAIGSGFAGTSNDALSFVIPFVAEILSIALFALGGSALLVGPKIPVSLLLAGPILSIITVAFLAGSVFRNSVAVISLTLPQGIFALAALAAGLALRKSALTTECPQV